LTLTIKNKIILTVLVLILSIQVISAVIQYAQVRTVLGKEFVQGAQGLSQAPYIDLMRRLGTTVNAANSNQKEFDQEVIDSVNLFIGFVQNALFKDILLSREDLLEITYIDALGNVPVASKKTREKVESFNESHNVDLTPSDTVLALAKNQEKGLIEEDDKLNIFVPFIFKDKSYGGLILVYSDMKIKETRNKIFLYMAITTIVALAVFIPITWYISSRITKPIQGVVNRFKDIAEGEGDLTIRLDESKKDETGELSKWFNAFMVKLQGLIQEISENADSLNTSATNLSDLANHMSEGAEKMSAKTTTVASASEEMSTNISSVSAAMEETATNVNLVASAIEEMTATITEIAQNSEKGSTISTDAVVKVKEASERASELGKDALEINKVTETITEISEQTNLLALNATIEAARAGEYGKGFAVVANEIKELARQTAEATLEIKAKISSIQDSTAATVNEFEHITTVIHQVNDIVTAIAASVEEQSVTATEVATNINQISAGIQEVNENVAQSSAVAGEIAKNISDTSQGADEISSSSSQVDMSSSELSQLAEQLNKMVRRFKV
jgi:methyl-accepting chemotaxis protein